jgi:hypothetical protein
MAEVNARVSDLEGSRLPPVCAKTGEPTDGYAKMEFSSSPPWTWILLLFGILPFLIAHFFASVHVVGFVPMSDVAQRRVTVFNRLFIGFVVLSLVVIGIGWALDTEADLILVGSRCWSPPSSRCFLDSLPCYRAERSWASGCSCRS